jgi:serine/threonine protein kinase
MLIVGQTVGSYRILTLLGDGGFAMVFHAVHEALGSDHAVKVLKPELVANEEIRLRFLDEARIQARLQHPNIVRVTDILALPGVAAIVMDLAPGEPLSSWLASRPSPPSSLELRRILIPLLDALGYAHANGIVHRDLKPENVVLETGADGVLVPRVLDFGIAQVRGDIGSRTNKRSTIADRRMGTSGYMSPEQIRSAKDVDARSDIFALGVILLELATLKHPFERATDFDTMQAVVNGDYVIPQDLWDRDPAIASALRMALQPKAADRFDNCARFAEAIGAVSPRPAGGARVAAASDPAAQLSRSAATSRSASRRVLTDPAPESANLIGAALRCRGIYLNLWRASERPREVWWLRDDEVSFGRFHDPATNADVELVVEPRSLPANQEENAYLSRRHLALRRTDRGVVAVGLSSGQRPCMINARLLVGGTASEPIENGRVQVSPSLSLELECWRGAYGVVEVVHAARRGNLEHRAYLLAGRGLGLWPDRPGFLGPTFVDGAPAPVALFWDQGAPAIWNVSADALACYGQRSAVGERRYLHPGQYWTLGSITLEVTDELLFEKR